MALRPRSKSQHISRRRQLRLTKISRCAAWLASCLTADLRRLLRGLGVNRLAALRLQEVVGEAENLKTVAVTDDPKIQLVSFPVGGRDFDEASQTRLLLDGSIGGW
jgi:hypothetical protein